MNEYPSTFDVPAIAGGQDAVLVCMETAFGRVLKRWTRTDYIGWAGSVCAIGAIIAADGKTWRAIRLLDASAKELYPWDSGNMHYPLESVNQYAGKKAVIAVYKHAIAARQGSLIH